MNCGDIEENPGVLDQCYKNNSFVTNAVLGVRNSDVLLETRSRELNRIAVDVGGGGDCFSSCCVNYLLQQQSILGQKPFHNIKPKHH